MQLAFCAGQHGVGGPCGAHTHWKACRQADRLAQWAHEPALCVRFPVLACCLTACAQSEGARSPPAAPLLPVQFYSAAAADAAARLAARWRRTQAALPGGAVLADGCGRRGAASRSAWCQGGRRAVQPVRTAPAAGAAAARGAAGAGGGRFGAAASEGNRAPAAVALVQLSGVLACPVAHNNGAAAVQPALKHAAVRCRSACLPAFQQQ